MAADDDRRDALGVVHSRAAAGARIVSLVPSLTELLFALGLGAHLVGRTGFCIHPRDAIRRVPKVGGTKTVDIAKVRALAPTHLVVNIDENRRETVDALRQDGPDVIVTHPLGPDDNPVLYRLFGAIFGREVEAAALCRRYESAKKKLRDVVADLPEERVLYLIWRKPWQTVSRETYISATLALARWRTLPVTTTSRYPTLAADDPAWSDADRIFLSSEPYAFRERDAASLRAEWQTRLGRNGAITLIDGEMTSWYGNRAIAGLAYLAVLRRTLAS
jgi:ABC-type Fe3+-hydroxamate transport system substrate-binding protein